MSVMLMGPGTMSRRRLPRSALNLRKQGAGEGDGEVFESEFGIKGGVEQGCDETSN